MTDAPAMTLIKAGKGSCLHCIVSQTMQAMQKALGPMDAEKAIADLGQVIGEVIASHTGEPREAIELQLKAAAYVQRAYSAARDHIDGGGDGQVKH